MTKPGNPNRAIWPTRREQAPTKRELQTSWKQLREAKAISGFRHGITYTKEDDPIRFYPIVSEANRKQSWAATLKELMDKIGVKSQPDIWVTRRVL